MKKTFNFSAGPAMLPIEVMKQAQEEFLDFYHGMSAMEISHRHSRFTELMEELNNNFIKLLNIPKNYKILWTTGGATLQFSMIPLNLMGLGFGSENKNNNNFKADYLSTGHWSDRAAEVAKKYINVNKIINQINQETHRVSQKVSQKVYSQDYYQDQLSQSPLYLYYTPNETLTGLKFNYIPDTKSLYKNNTPLVADMTSCILSEPIDISKFGIVFASTQKNMGHSGLTVIIIREDLLRENKYIPDVTSYKLLAEHNSVLNTPPTYNFYIINLVLKWLLKQGGLSEVYRKNLKKSEKLYNFIDGSEFYYNTVYPDYRSLMNVCFFIKNNNTLRELENNFISQAQDNNLFNLSGHRTIGGFRASIYNAMPEEGVDKLIEFMKFFMSY